MSRLRGRTGAPSLLLSACMIVCDAEATLEECLASLLELVCEILIIDTGSSDRSVMIAKDLGARVYHEPWKRDFSFHRNQSLARARGLWAIIIDSDNKVVNTDFRAVRTLLEAPDTPPALVVREILRYPHGREVIAAKTRLFRLDQGFSYRFPVHEQLDLHGCTPGQSGLTMVHYGYETVEETQRKEERNLAIAMTMADDRHGFYRRAKAARSLRKWDLVIDQCQALLACEAPAWQRTEACVLGGIAAFNSGQERDLSEFMEEAWALAPGNADVVYMELLALAGVYARLSEESERPVTAASRRPWVFWHSGDRGRQLLQFLTGQYEHAGEVPDRHEKGGRK